MSSETDIFREISEGSPDCIFVFDFKENTISFVNKAVEALLGLSQEEVISKPEKLLEIIHPDDQEYVKSKQPEVKPSSPFIKLDFRLLLPGQKTKWVQLKGYGVRAKSPQPQFVAFVEDITERKEAELNFYTVKEQKDVVLQILGHDLRAPLNTIKMSSLLLEKEFKNSKEEDVERLLKIINVTCNNSLELIREILDMEYLESQAMPLRKSRVDIVARLQNQVDTFHLRDRQKTIILDASEPAVYVEVDVLRFMLVVENILSNAYKFTADDGRISISVKDKGETVLLTFEDNGIGIPDKLKPYIFDKFTKARRPGMRGERPVGLGMHLIRTLVKMHNGDIWFESEEEKGTTFYVEVPKF
ncbi:PAS domain-containing sensor histidine kinase [Nafulsella turpanensis]|uniref:PAS domain-containing sensor histidine kinase n=1 Tax=Nafulsella turpanensis TaxID=1265690 RepID=UPI0003474AB5|nr:PAS domain-containing sensor histidine kinase [Nafulsella turpanensis]